jgi:hypothetical protein
VRRSSKDVSPVGETPRTSTVRVANLSHAGECLKSGILHLGSACNMGILQDKIFIDDM